jgi:SAM-dependent methyltransferase
MQLHGKRTGYEQETSMMKRSVRPWRIPALPGETADQTNRRRDDAYFAEQIVDNEEWLRRMGRDFNFKGKRVLDLGCGHGALSVLAAKLGASQVVGIDLDVGRVDYANHNVRARLPEFANVVRFEAVDIALHQGEYDMVISKDAFEHIDELQDVLDHIYRLLAPNGVLASGFGPLYYSPFGDHRRFRLGLPWLHAVMPEPVLARFASWREKRPVRSASDLGLNKLTTPALGRFLAHQPWRRVDARYNQGSKPLFKAFNVLRRVPVVEKYFTVNAYLLAYK